MARGRSYGMYCTRDELRSALQEIDRQNHIFGYMVGRKEMFVTDIQSLDDMYWESADFIKYCFRIQPLDQRHTPDHYDRHLIYNGLMMIYYPGLRGMHLRSMFISVGTDPPQEGIVSPLPLFGSLRYRLRKLSICKVKDILPDSPFGDTYCSPKVSEMFASGKYLPDI